MDEVFYAVSAWASSPRDCGGDPSATRRDFELCECSESVIIVRLTADPMTFLRAIPYPAVDSAKEKDAPCVARILFDEDY